MTKAIIYSGFLRTWDRVKQNHIENIFSDTDVINFYLIDYPYGKVASLPVEKQLESFSPALALNAAPETHILNTLNQWRNRQKAFFGYVELSSRKFDVYVISRTDIIFSGEINFTTKPNTVYIPKGNDYRDGINDQFAFGDYNAIKHYCSLYEAYKGYFNEGLQFHPETYLKRHLRDLNVVRIPQTNQIIR